MKLYNNILLTLSFSVYTFSSENTESQFKLLEQKIDEILSMDVSWLVKDKIKKHFALKYEELYDEMHVTLDKQASDYDKKLEIQGNSIRQSLIPLIKKIDRFEAKLCQASSCKREVEKESESFIKEATLVEYFDKLRKEFTSSLEEIKLNMQSLIVIVGKHNNRLALLAEEQSSLRSKIDNLEKIQTSSSISLIHGLTSTRILRGTKSLSLSDSQDSFHTDSND